MDPSPDLVPAPTLDHTHGRRAVEALLLAGLGLLATWCCLELTDTWRRAAVIGPRADLRPSDAVVVAAVAVGLAVTVGCWWPLRAYTGHVPALLGGAGVILAGTGLSVLHGTRWAFDGLYSDAGFRTEMVTRYAASPSLSDYSYRDLPAYYPPLLPWLQGRAADLLHVPGWTVMKPTQLLVCLVVPTLGWLLWRRVLPTRTAAWVAATAPLVVALPGKPDEFLVLVLLVPWWLEVCRGVTGPGQTGRGPVGHGLVLGVMLLCHTFFFVPVALATAVGVLTDLARRRPMRPRPLASLVVALVGLAVAAPSWWALAAAHWQGLPSDDLQRRWSPLGFELPPLPLPLDPLGVLQLGGVAWLLWAVRRSEMARGLLLVLLTSYAFMVVGQLLEDRGVALLPEKTGELIEVVLAASGALAVAQVLSWWRTRARPAWSSGTALVVAAGLAGLLVVQTQEHGVARPARPAQTMRYPDGAFPAGGSAPGSPHWHPWGVTPGASGPSVQAVAGTWRALGGGPLGQDDVVLSARADVSATLPVDLFASWKSIYSHPNAQFDQRLDVVRALGGCLRPTCAYDLLRGNQFDAVDGLVLNRDDRSYFITVAVDRFPDAWQQETVAMDPRIFEDPRFRVALLPGAVVVRVRA